MSINIYFKMHVYLNDIKLRIFTNIFCEVDILYSLIYGFLNYYLF